VALPISTAITAVLALFYTVGQWNGWFGAFIYLNDPGKRPLQLVLRGILIQTIIDPALLSADEQTNIMYLQELLKYALIVVATLPVLVLYPFLQRYFVKGIMLGSIKG
jgi:ABC-type glycerol-3-phosphate transport system permease component